MLNFRQNYEILLSAEIQQAIGYVSEAADDVGAKVYLIGGVVRDLMLGIPCYDIDITVEGNAIDFVKVIEQKSPNIACIIEIHEDFKTAKLCFVFNNRQICFDFASTRKESYKTPASLPIVEEIGCGLYEDVIRRDFTINSMALSLNKSTFCDLTDYLNGYEDLQNKKLRILHDNSFVDDPTRIIRGLKFSIRFGFTLEENTKDLQNACLASGKFDNLASERIKQELKQTLNLNKIESFLRILDEKIYKLIDVDIPESINITKNAETLIEKYSRFLKTKDNLWLVYFGLFLKDFDTEKIKGFALKFNLNSYETQVLLKTQELFGSISLLTSVETNYDIYKIFVKYPKESILSVLVLDESSMLEEKIDLFLTELHNVKVETTGQDLIELGFKPDKKFGEILEKLLEFKLNKQIFTKSDETNFIQTLYS